MRMSGTRASMLISRRSGSFFLQLRKMFGCTAGEFLERGPGSHVAVLWQFRR